MSREKADIKDLGLAKVGQERIEWADKDMPVLKLIRERFEKERPLKGVTMAACLHVTAETANLMRTLQAGGARVALCASNPLSTQDDVAASLLKDYGLTVFAIKGEDRETYYRHLNQTIDLHPIMTMDDGADLVSLLHANRKKEVSRVIGGTEETTTGVIRLKSLADQKKLLYPIVAVNDAETKHFFDNRYGTGQSTMDGIIRATGMLIAGKTVVVVGYGWCGRGFATKAKGMGANVIVTEVDAVKALEAAMDGFMVMPMNMAAKMGDLFVTLTGDINVIDKEHFKLMKDGAIVCNSGHFNAEINIPALEKMAKSKKRVKYLVDEYILPGQKRIYLLAEGRLINLAAAEGHPAAVMDMSFANQALSAEYMIKNYKKLEKRVYPVPMEIDKNIADLKLKAMGITIDKLTAEQKKYLSSWEMGT
ncbi:MAG TPA: adenosylhomocysteinase [Patescibacteria group bacterium]|nr:adenosylhomocysteinase [Patescibacteria group bacterium]